MSNQMSPVRERPRERLHRLGVRALSLHELLMVLVGSGGSAGAAEDIAASILKQGRGELRNLARMTPQALERLPGVGPAVACRVAASLELGRRAASEPAERAIRVRGPEDVYRCLGPTLRDLPHEEFHALLLNTQHRVMSEVLVTRGILDASLVHPREVFRPAVIEGASAIILVHNHPSGDPTPSTEDHSVTRRLMRAGRAIGIPVLDHVIIGDGRWCAIGADDPDVRSSVFSES